uniref:Uncharacterized protein n=1 Tax=viral metagenome TaxID=1070528 RepID=A0A6M3J7D8_9ZZZZ
MKIHPRSFDIRLAERETDVAVWFDAPGYQNCFRSFSSRELAERFVAGEDVVPVIVKSRRVKISSSAAYPGQDEEWTERGTGEEILSSAITVYHFGRKANRWNPKVTCFYRSWPSAYAELPSDRATFVAELPPGCSVEYFDNDEVRVDLGQHGVKVWLAK